MSKKEFLLTSVLTDTATPIAIRPVWLYFFAAICHIALRRAETVKVGSGQFVNIGGAI